MFVFEPSQAQVDVFFNEIFIADFNFTFRNNGIWFEIIFS